MTKLILVIALTVTSVSVGWCLHFQQATTVDQPSDGFGDWLVLAQLDDDPMMEVVLPPGWSGDVKAYDHNGAFLWSFHTGWYGFLNADDVNGDGYDEVVVSSADRHLYYLDHSGNLLWSYPIRELGHHMPKLCQLDGDSDLEVVLGEWDSNTYSASTAYVYALDLQNQALLWEYPMPDDCWAYAKDLNGDGLAEVFATNRPTPTPSHVALLGPNGALHWNVVVDGVWPPADAHAYDYNGDGYLDPVLSNGTRVLDYQNGQQLAFSNIYGNFSELGVFQSATVTRVFTSDANNLYCLSAQLLLLWTFPMPSGNVDPRARVLDANLDGVNEILVVGSLRGDRFWFLNENGAVQCEEPLPPGGADYNWPPYRMGDFSGDGIPDLVLANGQTTHLYYFRQISHNVGYVSLISPGPPNWAYRLQWVSGALSRLAFANFCSGTVGSVSGAAQAAGWTVTNYSDSIVFTTVTPLTAGSIETFWLSHPSCAAQVIWTAGDSSGSVDGPLPVELLGISAAAVTGGIEVQWNTVSETNNDRFEIMRGTSQAGEFARITALPSQGNSATGHHYEYLDREVSAGQTYWYYLADVDLSGNRTEHRELMRSVTMSGSAELPSDYALSAYPNPFNPSTTISFALPEADVVRIAVFDVAGRWIQTLVNEERGAGNHTVTFDARDLPSGVYFARMESGQFTMTEKMLLIR